MTVALSSLIFFLNETAPTEVYTLSLHDALPISTASLNALQRSSVGGDTPDRDRACSCQAPAVQSQGHVLGSRRRDRKSTRLNSSHITISYAVFCLKKKKEEIRSGNAKRTPSGHS